MWNPSFPSYFHQVLPNAIQLWSFKQSHHYEIFMGCHHGTDPVMTSCGDLQRHSGHRQDECNCGVFTIPDHTKLIRGLCNIKEWWRWHRLHTLARFGRNFVCHVTYLPISPQGRPRFEFSYSSNLQLPVEFRIVHTEKLLRTETPVELAQWFSFV